MRSIARVIAAVAVCLLLGAAAIRQPTLFPLRTRSALHSDATMLRRHVDFLTTRAAPRTAENLMVSALYIERAFRASGARVELQDFDARRRRYRNVIARFGPATGEVLIVGAHYDAFCETGENPGADDNASGTAGLLELARLLGRTQVTRPLMLVAYANEEPPFFGSEQMGSAVHAGRLRGRVAGMICLEMIGYFTPEQPWPNATFAALYPSRGDFIAIGGGWSDRAFTRHVKRSMHGAGMRACSFTGPRSTLDASDQRNYWARGWPAVLVTDTAYLRNPNYHTRRDTAATLDYTRMARVVDGVFNACNARLK